MATIGALLRSARALGVAAVLIAASAVVVAGCGGSGRRTGSGTTSSVVSGSATRAGSSARGAHAGSPARRAGSGARHAGGGARAGGGGGSRTGAGGGSGSGAGGGSGSGAGSGRPSAAGAVAYGLGDAPGTFAQCAPGHPRCCAVTAGRCAPSQMTGYFDSAAFLRLTSSASVHRIRELRLFVPYDAASEWNGARCVPSRVLTRTWTAPAGYGVPAGLALSQFIAGVIEAHADGLTPLVTVTGYGFPSGRPPWDQPMPDPTTAGGAATFECGIRGIVTAVDRLPVAERPHVWEPLNEPETFRLFAPSGVEPSASECTPGDRPAPNGPAKAACAQALGQRTIRGVPGHAGDVVLAGDFQHPYADYLGPFVSELSRQLPGASFPSAWSVHDYHEVTEGYSGAPPTQLSRFDAALARDTHGRARSLWVTEAATVITSTFPQGHCPAIGVDQADTLGACLDGDAAVQARSNATFFSLPEAARAVPITHLFWYQLTGAAGWDSGLLAPDGVPRPIYCRFLGSGRCPGSPAAA